MENKDIKYVQARNGHNAYAPTNEKTVVIMGYFIKDRSDGIVKDTYGQLNQELSAH